MVSSEQTINKMTTITEVKKVAVDHVIHPVTRDKIDYNQALINGEEAILSKPLHLAAHASLSVVFKLRV